MGTSWELVGREMVWLKLPPVEDGAVVDVAPHDAAGSLVAEDELGGP